MKTRRRGIARRTRLAVMVSIALAAGLIPASGIAAAAGGPTTPAKQHSNGQLFSAPATALGKDWQHSTDRTVTGTGDSAGFHILVADEASSFTYREAADLTESALEGIGPWTGYVCTTGSGRYAAAVYAPSTATNKPALMQHGAFAAVVDLATGKVTQAATGVQLAYFSPGCGTSDTVSFTRSSVGDSGHGDTTVLDFDAATGKTVRTSIVKGQFTNPVPTADGDLGVLGGRLVRLSPQGDATDLAVLPGQAFALAPSADNAVDVALVENGKDVLQRWNGKSLSTLGTAPLGSLGLYTQSKGDLVAGNVSGINTASAPGLHRANSPRKPVAVSRQGHLLTTAAVSQEMHGISSSITSPSGQGAGVIHLSGVAPGTGSSATTDLVTSEAKPLADEVDDVEPLVDLIPEYKGLGQHGLDPDGGHASSHLSPCLVERNDPHGQALQASANMVEWAVDQAVHGDLTTPRPADYMATGNPSYSPQGLFPLPSLTGGGTVPAQVMLGILAQESNFKQASFHAVPGDAGNPTLGDYFGNGDDIHKYPNSAKADCGYGIAQVTTGMNGSKPMPYNSTEAHAIASDYAANISAGLQILGQTWNQLKQLNMNVNTGDPQYIENWSMALWGYNSGVYTDASQNDGHTGVGWFNNPANPNYRSDRAGFLRDSYDDASHPGDWPYQEKIMGWAETPQTTYNGNPSYILPAYPADGGPARLRLSSSYNLYCSSDVNNCDSSAASGSDPCPAENATCFWNKSVFWNSAAGSKEQLRFSAGSGEPALDRQYPAGPCNNAPTSSAGNILIDDLPDPNDNVFGCKQSQPGESGGKFTLRDGDNFTMERSDNTWRATGDIAPIDLHQLGAGYDGHLFFTHAYPSNSSNFLWHRITATWTPDPTLLAPPNDTHGVRYDILVHLPNHGAQAVVPYTVNVGLNNTGAQPTHTCAVNQATASNGKDVWRDLGTVRLWAGASIQANNTSRTAAQDGSGDEDVAFDAIDLVPVGVPQTSNPCFDD